ncbi:MAG: prepilin-type N-terminal cleavage/methylation domain-containing protein [Verrucomicrobiae bacterium]|nr:prepilin-type N-terminal cleavage/methylation domain-containing protein [Verrucomicrobiae bacterium]
MGAHRTNSASSAFTLVEVLVVAAIIVVLILMVLPATDRRSSTSTIAPCVNNQRQIVLAEMMWAADHHDSFPWRAKFEQEMPMEFSARRVVSPYFQLLSNYNLKLESLICPTDIARTAADSYADLADSNVSYFVHLNAATNNGQTILHGDRHLQVNKQPLTPGLQVIQSNAPVSWTRELHGKSAKTPLGVLSFTDGHAEVVKEKLPEYFRRQGLAATRLALP